jgi:hypothetical protein
MTTEIQHTVEGETVTVHVTILSKFEDCKEDMKSPFKHSKTVTEVGFDPAEYENVFIRCEIYPENWSNVLRSRHVSGESVCHEVVHVFLNEKYPGKTVRLYESIFCNHFEVQYRYLVS